MSVLDDHATTRATQWWVVDPARSTVEFRVPNFWGLTTVVGQFTRFEGSYAVGPNGRAVELVVDAASLDTGHRRRDEHLRSGAFFDAERKPHVRFTAHDVTETGDGALRVRGELEVAGTKVPLALEAPVRELDGELEVEATARVDQRLLGMTWSPLGTVRAPATLHVRARLTGATDD
jgi:polyisoprenoid-binding protein YceI